MQSCNWTFRAIKRCSPRSEREIQELPWTSKQEAEHSSQRDIWQFTCTTFRVKDKQPWKGAVSVLCLDPWKDAIRRTKRKMPSVVRARHVVTRHPNER